LRRYVIAAIVFLMVLIAAQVFLNQTSVGSPRFVRMTLFLLTARVVIVLALLILATILGRNLIKLYFERKSGQVGSGFKSKMVRAFIALSLLPALLLFFLAYGLISFSMNQWFSAPGAQMMEYSKALATQYYREAELREKRLAEKIAASIQSEDLWSSERKSDLDQKLQGLRSDYEFDSILLFDQSGRQLAESGHPVAPIAHKAWIATLVEQTLLGQTNFQVERVTPNDALKEVTRAAAPLRDPQGAVVGAVLTETVNPQSMHFKADSVQEAYGVYEQLQTEQTPLRFNFLLIMALSTLLIVFAFSWFAMYLAKRITIPIQALAEGAAAVSAGNLEYRVKCEAFDELDSLVATFNRMTGDLQENKHRIEAAQNTLRRANVESEDRRRYIETILQTIATGVVSLNGQYQIRTMNRAAMQMFDVQGPYKDADIEKVVPAPASETLRMLLNKSSVLGPVVRNIELVFPDKTMQLATTVTPLIDGLDQRSGWVVVLDDVSELLRMEKMAAWQEVARRLAHEIKNPLTPIQLSAERILYRYKRVSQAALPDAGSGPWQVEFNNFGNLLDECIRSIIQEADSLKRLVDEFSQFARFPGIRLEVIDLHWVLDAALALYNGRIQDVRIQKQLATGLPKVCIDPQQMKRVFINLIDNALEAMAGSVWAKTLCIRTSLDTKGASVRIEISDTGKGFPKDYQDNYFLPYFSTRKGGTGLGLVIVRQIITDHHGYIRVEPNSPLGTKITIDLPLAAA